MSSLHNFNIGLNMQNAVPEKFRIKPDEFETFDKGYYYKNHRINDGVNKEFPFNKNLDDWKIEILFEDHMWIYAKIFINTEGDKMIIPISVSEVHGELTNIIEGDMIIGKHISEKLNYRCAWNCYNNFSRTQINFNEKHCLEIAKQIKEKLRIEGQRKIFF